MTPRTTVPVEFNEGTNPASYQRVKRNGTILRRLTRYLYVVALTDDRKQRDVILSRDDDEHSGWCECDAFTSGVLQPCAHLWAVYHAERNKVIEIRDTDDAIGAHDCPTCGQTVPRSVR